MKTFNEYLKERKLTQAQVANQLGTNQATVSRWISGSMPRRKMLKKIKEWSCGEMTAESFVNY